jgi:hypothetical protein
MFLGEKWFGTKWQLTTNFRPGYPEPEPSLISRRSRTDPTTVKEANTIASYSLSK